MDTVYIVMLMNYKYTACVAAHFVNVCVVLFIILISSVVSEFFSKTFLALSLITAVLQCVHVFAKLFQFSNVNIIFGQS